MGRSKKYCVRLIKIEFDQESLLKFVEVVDFLLVFSKYQVHRYMYQVSIVLPG